MKLFLPSICAIILAAASITYSSVSLSSEYIYKDIMGNTLPPAKCADKGEAGARSTDDYNVGKFVKTFCETQGYGWHVAEEKSAGKLVCQECSSDQGKFQCHLEDVVVTCKRLKPGSVGMLPGKG